MTFPTTSEHRLVLKDYEAIINASKKFAAEPQLAETTQIIIIEEEVEYYEEEDQEEEDEEEEEEIADTKTENKFRAITTILTECSKHQKLEALKWHKGQEDSSTRPAEFWEALNKVAPKLQHLSFDFYIHELHRMKETGISAKFPSKFPLLKSLYVDCSGAHGDDGSPIEKLLHGLPNLRVLHIDAPICDLESCRIKGLTWAYKFPQLTHLAISIFYQSAQDIGSFLANHPNIRTLMFDAEGEEPIPNVTSLLPNLEALSKDGWGQTEIDGYNELLSANPLRKITYFKTEHSPYDKYCLIPQYAPSLRCLELSLDIEEIRDEDAQYRSTKALLALMPDLSELAIHFSSGWTTIFEEENEEDEEVEEVKGVGTSRRNPLPMNEEILSKIMKALPKSRSSNLQVLRMKDHDEGKGSPLAVQSSTFASLRENIPPSLKVLQWEIEKSIVRYEFEPGQSVRIVDPPEQRQWPDTLLWTDASILEHLRS